MSLMTSGNVCTKTTLPKKATNENLFSQLHNKQYKYRVNGPYLSPKSSERDRIGDHPSLKHLRVFYD